MGCKMTAWGRLTRDAELKYTQTGTAILSFVLAASEGFGDRKVTTFLECSLFGKQAEGLSQHMVKGKGIIVTGAFKAEKWESNGKNGMNLRLEAKDIDFMPDGAGHGEQGNTPGFRQGNDVSGQSGGQGYGPGGGYQGGPQGGYQGGPQGGQQGGFQGGPQGGGQQRGGYGYQGGGAPGGGFQPPNQGGQQGGFQGGQRGGFQPPNQPRGQQGGQQGGEQFTDDIPF